MAIGIIPNTHFPQGGTGFAECPPGRAAYIFFIVYSPVPGMLPILGISSGFNQNFRASFNGVCFVIKMKMVLFFRKYKIRL